MSVKSDELEVGNEEYHIFSPVKYISNSFSVMKHDDIAKRNDSNYLKTIQINNERYLKHYYKSMGMNLLTLKNKGQLSSTTTRVSDSHSSVSPNSSAIDSYNSSAIDKANVYEYIIGNISYYPEKTLLNSFSDIAFDVVATQNEDDTHVNAIESQQIFNSKALYVYFNHFDKLSTLDNIKPSLGFDNNDIWIPAIRSEFRDRLSSKKRDKIESFKGKSCPLFIEGTGYIPPEFDTFGGSTMISSYFGNIKLPSLVYHSTVKVNDQVFLFGGLVPSYKYDEEAPNLKSFRIKDFIKVPPPLIPNIINNPAMVENPFLYSFNPSSNRFEKNDIHGLPPPPLICVKGTKITDRYIFYYGGFELKTTWYMEDDIYYLEKNIYMNPDAYILDILSFTFKKVDIYTIQKHKFGETTIQPRFGHCQIHLQNVDTDNSVYTDSTSSKASSVEAVSNPNISLSKSPRILLLEKNASKHSQKSTKKRPNSRKPYDITMLIFGGYIQKSNQSFMAVNDMWKINIQVMSKGKKGYLIFRDGAEASVIARRKKNTNNTETNKDPWPEPRAFGAYCIPDIYSIKKKTLLNSHLDKYYMDTNMSESNTDAPNSNQNNNEENSYCLSYPIQENINESTLLYHGGANQTHIFGDMWSFNIVEETWQKLPEYARVSSDKREPKVLIELGLVGHTLFTVGNMIVTVGGLLQCDVKKIYCEENASLRKNSYLKHGDALGEEKQDSIPIGASILNIFDINSLCLQGNNVKTMYNADNNTFEYLFQDNSNLQNQLLISIASTPIQINGTILILGGLVAFRTDVNEFYLRGTVLECILPSVSLAS
ncbi:hypothetical protein TPHA_0H03070 [Tetrapisispora phaffii CBS 4417]|uniref:Uncharacterized protein n=1 Tax=Tetrapisispora phaffii (strain ATCC 24235 / CBS 4417 / NBRC 1672 / NRRL Y-8282 / UCD 70-5) TaxID=1071381 RepID=G8BWQ9_TETPH|nr:hypothetical protein TPHA_0H03070 [Tetrapisispora phaffii CBS 4417]CCE64510.1 hypothetical protein TPHA_0H03070 [Tetrapisispora phaffii CBS 4417]